MVTDKRCTPPLSLAVTKSGALYVWGDGDGGKLGHGDEEDQLQPKRVEGLQGVCGIAAGSEHGVAVAKDGTAHGWGDGDDECLGLQLTEHQMTPLKYPALRLAVPQGGMRQRRLWDRPECNFGVQLRAASL